MQLLILLLHGFKFSGGFHASLKRSLSSVKNNTMSRLFISSNVITFYLLQSCYGILLHCGRWGVCSCVRLCGT